MRIGKQNRETSKAERNSLYTLYNIHMNRNSKPVHLSENKFLFNHFLIKNQ